jgi:hypothetical protein
MFHLRNLSLLGQYLHFSEILRQFFLAFLEKKMKLHVVLDGVKPPKKLLKNNVFGGNAAIKESILKGECKVNVSSSI